MIDFYENISKNRLFILGAGFSAGAGIPMVGTLLKRTMAIFKEESKGLFERVDNYAKVCFQKKYIDYSALDFSYLCTFLEYIELREYGGGERFSDSGSREKIAFKYYLSKAIALSTPQEDDMPEIYLKFARQLKRNDIVITFNWDTLLEKAIRGIGKTFAYSNFENTNADIYIFKLHGSVNWRIDNNIWGKQLLSWKPLNFSTGMMKNEVFYCDELFERETWKHYMPFSEVEPFIVLPGFGKGFDVRYLAPLWYKPDAAFAYTKDIYIIGFSLANDDYFIKSLFLDNLLYIEDEKQYDRKLFVINPDKTIKNNFDFLSNVNCVEYIFEKFNDSHIDMILGRLANFT